MFPNQSAHGVVLAPMEGVTDAPFREFLTAEAPYDYCVTEFMRISTHAPRVKKFQFHIPELKQSSRTKSGTLLQVQILGGNAENMAESALNAVRAGALGIDINFGCPAPLVNRHDGGANLLKSPQRIFEIVSTIRKKIPSSIPVSAKMRLGWDSVESILENANAAADAGADWLTIHARTKSQYYKSPVHWDKIAEVKKVLKIPIVANGDIWTFNDFLKCREITGCTHFMLARGALASPHLAEQIKNYFLLSSLSENRVAPSWEDIFKRFVETNSHFVKNPNYSLCRLKQWISLSKPAGTLRWAEPLLRVQTVSAFLEELRNLRNFVSNVRLPNSDRNTHFLRGEHLRNNGKDQLHENLSKDSQ